MYVYIYLYVNIQRDTERRARPPSLGLPPTTLSLSSKFGTYGTVKSGFWPWNQVKAVNKSLGVSKYVSNNNLAALPRGLGHCPSVLPPLFFLLSYPRRVQS